MGAGITIGGLAGADVGIGGDIHLVDVLVYALAHEAEGWAGG